MLFHRLLSHSLSVPIPSLRVARRQTGSGQEGEPVREGAEPPGCITFWVGKKKALTQECVLVVVEEAPAGHTA